MTAAVMYRVGMIMNNYLDPPLLQAAEALVAALIDDPFYSAISEDFGTDVAARQHALKFYFRYSLEEARRTGRCVIAPDPTLGAAAWLLPRTSEVALTESTAKSEYLHSVLGPRGRENYRRIASYMAPRAAEVVPSDAWYLSIIGIVPSAQGQGLGAALLTGTLVEASNARAPCYLETFSPRNLKFYERFGFCRAACHFEPTTNKEYFLMRRDV